MCQHCTCCMFQNCIQSACLFCTNTICCKLCLSKKAPTPYTSNCAHLEKNTVHSVYFNLCLSSASTMQAVYSLWDYVPLKNTVRTVFSHIFLCTSMLQLCPPQRKIPNIRYMSIKYRTYGIFSHFFCARVCWNCVHLKEKYRTYGTCP